MNDHEEKEIINQFGVHYFQDTFHYRNEDLKFWLPILKNLKTGWMVLKSDKGRAIPEDFINSLLKNGITPIIEFNLPIKSKIGTRDLKLLIQMYAKWGVKYVIFYDKPNQKKSWTDNYWTQSDLIDRFLDLYIPLAKFAINEGLIPVFPPLEPGGNYWDTAFLRNCLKSLIRREQTLILENLVLSAYGFTFNRDLNWGIGGPESWPMTKPYITPNGSQDQKGFRIYDWYQAIASALLQREVPIILLGGGINSGQHIENLSPAQIKKDWFNQKLISMILHNQQSISMENGISIEPVPPSVLACNFWVLAADLEQHEASSAWFLERNIKNPYVSEMIETFRQEQKSIPTKNAKQSKSRRSDPKQCLINHYVLLPDYEHEISEWDFQQITPLLIKSKATIGYSVDEAVLSHKVTLLDGENNYSDATLHNLKKFGCVLEYIGKNGTTIAT